MVRPEYKQTNVGVIPEDWNPVSIETITTHVGDGLHGTPVYSTNGEYFFINGNNLIAGRIVVSSDTRSVDYSEYIKHRKPLNDRSILLSINGTIGNLGLFAGEPIVLGKSAAYLNVKPQISRQFVYQSLQTHIVNQQFLNGMTGSTIGNLGLATIRQTEIPMPPTEAEQRAIAAALSDVDALLAGHDRLIDKKRDLKQAAMQQLLTGRTRLPGFQREWELKRLGDVAHTLKGHGLSKSHLSISGSRTCILYGELFTKYGRIISVVESRTNSFDGLPSVAGDVLMPGSTTTSGIDLATASALVVEGVALGGDIIVIRMRGDDYDPSFLAAYLTVVSRRQIEEMSQGITIYHLYAKDLVSLPLRLPTLDEQVAIAAVLSDIDAELSALEARRDKTRALKQGMIPELLTGKTRLVPAGGRDA